MFRNMLKTILCLALALLLAALPAAAETNVEERLSDLETLRAGLEQGHYDLFALVTPAEWEARVEAAAETLRDEDTDDITACYALIELVASLGDAHTQAWFTGGNAQGMLRALPLQTGLFSGRVYLLATTEPYADYLGMEITAIAGVPMAEVFARLTPLISYDNEVRLQTQLAANIADAEGLRYVGILNDASQAEVTFTDAQGAQHTATVEALVGEEMYTAQFSFLEREAIPAAEQPAGLYEYRNYGDTLWIGYYSCAEDPEYPMADFVEDVAAELEAGNYAKVCVDLRYNGGGNSAILEPLIDRLAACGIRPARRLRAHRRKHLLLGGDERRATQNARRSHPRRHADRRQRQPLWRDTVVHAGTPAADGLLLHKVLRNAPRRPRRLPDAGHRSGAHADRLYFRHRRGAASRAGSVALPKTDIPATKAVAGINLPKPTPSPRRR